MKKLIAALAFCSLAAGCNRSPAAPAGAPANTAAVPQAAAKAPAKALPSKVVFVGKQNACECTRKAIDAGWASLEKALGTPPKLPVERVQIDTDEAMVAPYQELAPIMALPAIYFLDAGNGLVQQLQGEVTADQVAAVLGATAAAAAPLP